MPISWIMMRGQRNSEITKALNKRDNLAPNIAFSKENGDELFGKTHTTLDDVKKIFKDPIDIFHSIYRELASEQLGYLFKLKTQENKSAVLNRYSAFKDEDT